MQNAVSDSPDSAAAAGATPRSGRIPAIAICLLFILLGLVLIPYLGLQNDELLFASAIYAPLSVRFSAPVFGHRIPAMIMSYVGTLKSGVYWVIFAVWPPSPWSVRLPVLLLGAFTIWLLFVLLRDTIGTRAALAAIALLATDVCFILTTCFDWGPVALQHFLLLSGLLLLWRFHRTGSLPCLAAGFFAFGLALWDKALFSWSLVGLAVAAPVVFPGAVRARLTLRNVALAAAALVMGAAPLIVYNCARRFETLRENAKAPAMGFVQKAIVLRDSADGSTLLGYLVRDYPAPQAATPRNGFENAAMAVSRAAGGQRRGLLGLACVLALALLPWLWRTPARKPMLFALVFFAVTWGLMILTGMGGAAAHHTVLLWPFPHLFVAAAFAQASLALGRNGIRILAAAIVLVCLSNLLVLNQYVTQAIECGPTVIWTDAITPLSRAAREVPAKHIYVADWGIAEVLRALSRGSLPIAYVRDVLAGPLDESARLSALRMIGSSGGVFIDHTDGQAVLPGARGRLDAVAQSAGYRKEILRTISDRHGRPVFEVFRFIPSVPAAPG